MIIKHRLYLYASLLLMLAGCKLDKPDLSNINSTTTLSDTYQPVTKGSYWKYTYILNGLSDTATIMITGDSTMFNGRTYYAGTSTFSSAPTVATISYISRSGHIYTNRSDAPDEADAVELYYLNDTTAIGNGWTAPINKTGSIEGVPGQFVGKIVEKGISKTVAGKTYNHVIHTHVALQYDYGAGFTTFIVYDNYIAQGIGLIEIDSNGSGVTGTETLFDYSIK